MAGERAPWVGAWGVLGEVQFRRFLAGYLASFLGSEMVPVAVSFAVLGNGGSASDVGYVLTGEALPLVAFLLVGGVVADRIGRRPVMVAADLARLGAQGVLAVLLLTGHAGLWALIGLEAVVGAGQAFFVPAMTGLIPEVASAGRLQQANALSGLVGSVGTMVGPAVAGLIVAVANPGWAIAADAASYLVSAACLARLRLPVRVAVPASGLLSDLRLGWSELRSRTWLWVVVLDFTFFHLVVFAPMIVLGAVVAKASLGGAAAWGTILAAFGAGAVVGGVVMLRLRPRRPLVWGMLGTTWLAVPIWLLAARAPTVAISVGAAAAGAGFAAFGAIWDTTMQLQIPPALLSRVSSYDWFGSTALLPVGYAVAGPLAVLLGLSGALYLSGTWLVVTSLAVLAVPGVRRLQAGPPVAGPGPPARERLRLDPDLHKPHLLDVEVASTSHRRKGM